MLNSDPRAWEGEITHKVGAESTKKEETTTKPEREEADGKDKRQRRKRKLKGAQTRKKKKNRSGTRRPAFQNLRFWDMGHGWTTSTNRELKYYATPKPSSRSTLMAHLYFEHIFSGCILNTEVVLLILHYTFGSI